MEVEPISAVTTQGGAVRFNVTEQASRIATGTQAKRIEDSGIQQAHEVANNATGTAYSPALLAQAAQYALFTQAGAMAAFALLAYSPVRNPLGENPYDVLAVDAIQGSTVDTAT